MLCSGCVYYVVDLRGSSSVDTSNWQWEGSPEQRRCKRTVEGLRKLGYSDEDLANYVESVKAGCKLQLAAQRDEQRWGYDHYSDRIL